jgi:hypothetical protein
MAVRDVSAGIRGKEAIQAEIRGGAEVDVLQLDLSSMTSVRRFAAEFGSLNLPLNILMYESAHPVIQLCYLHQEWIRNLVQWLVVHRELNSCTFFPQQQRWSHGEGLHTILRRPGAALCHESHRYSKSATVHTFAAHANWFFHVV